jgi:hypothetical protein
MENETDWIGYATAIGSIATPILVTLLGAIGWGIRTRLQRRLDLEERLREDRITIYNNILEPFIILLMTDAAWHSDKKNRNKEKNQEAMSIILSLNYRKHGFSLSLMGSDEVVKCHNNLMQYAFHAEEGADINIEEILTLLGSLLLAIRRSMGNEATKLTKIDMIEWFITDARAYKNIA